MKKFCCFGSLNLDYVYHMPHFVRPGETLSSDKRDQNAGGKGLNQSCALAHAGAKVYHAGNIGPEGEFLKQTLTRHGVHTEFVRTVNLPTGHAIIQVDQNGENCIILFGGANQTADAKQMRDVLSMFEAGDTLVLQNEINGIDKLIVLAKQKGMKVALNPSPITENIFSLDLTQVDYLFINETEGAALSGIDKEDAVGMLAVLGEKYPHTEVVLTLGSKGACAAVGGWKYFSSASASKVVDTTAAGDTFTGYYLTARSEDQPVEAALKLANKAAGITVSRKGAADSIPYRKEV